MSEPIHTCFICGDKININEFCIYGNKGDKWWCGDCHDKERAFECLKCHDIVNKKEVQNSCCAKCYFSLPDFSDKMIWKPSSGPTSCEICGIPWAIEKTEESLNSCQDWEIKKKKQLQEDLTVLKQAQNSGTICETVERGSCHSSIEIGYNNIWIHSQQCEECGKVISKDNGQYGDRWEDKNHSCKQSERERERESKFNNISSNMTLNLSNLKTIN